MIGLNPESLTFHVLTPSRPEAEICAELDGLCMRDGLLQVVPAAVYRRFSRDDLMLWCMRRGFYCLPTTELLEKVRALIDQETAIEIGAGHGALGRALGIPITDSYQQARPDMRAMYEALQQAPVTYPPDVERLTALEAVEKHKPAVVLGCWVTHRYSPLAHALGGNALGVDEVKLWAKPSVIRYIFVGNESTHANKPLRRLPPRCGRFAEYRVDGQFSRSPHAAGDLIWVWDK